MSLQPQQPLVVIDHPLIQHKLTLLRDRDTNTQLFRALLKEISLLFAYEVTRCIRTKPRDVETPVATTRGTQIDGKKLVFVPVLRAGLGMVDGMLEILPSARVGHIGLYRDPKTLEAVEYYARLPERMEERDVIMLDPMLATGHSACAAVARVKESRARRVAFVCLLAAPEGIATLREAHPDISIYTGAIDERLNEKSYIVPGLGDAGDRIFGTK